MFGRSRGSGGEQQRPVQWGDNYPDDRVGSPPAGTGEYTHEGVAAVLERLTALEERQADHIDNLTALLAQRERTVVDMNDAVATARRDQVAVFLVPAAKKLIDLAHQMHTAALQRQEAGDVGTGTEFAYFVEKVDESLESLGFEKVAAEPGMPFDARRHRAAKTVRTSSPENDRTVASVLRHGYGFVGSTKTTFPATVTVHEYAEPSEEN